MLLLLSFILGVGIVLNITIARTNLNFKEKFGAKLLFLLLPSLSFGCCICTCLLMLVKEGSIFGGYLLYL